MVYGEDHARAFTGGSSARVAEKMAASGGAVLGSATATAAGQLKGESSRPSLRTAIENAYTAQKRIDETHSYVSSLADSAEALAQRISGPYPTEASPKTTDGAQRAAPQSTVQAVNHALDGVHGSISSLGSPIERLSRALGVIERAVG